MRRGRIIGVGAAVITAVLLSATAAFAATPRQIYADLADNGKLDNVYSKADLQNAALDASVQGYGGTEQVVLKPTAQVQAAQKTVCAEKNGATNGSTTGGMNGAKVCGHTYVCVGTNGSATSGTSTGGVNGANASSSRSCGHVLAAQHTAGALPFTGAQLTVFLVIGLALISSGLLLRRTAREKSRS